MFKPLLSHHWIFLLSVFFSAFYDGTPLQYSCLKNPMNGGAWQATVHGVTKSQTRLSNFTCICVQPQSIPKMHQQVESSPLSIAQVQNHSQRYSSSNHDHNFRLIERACIRESHTLIMILGIGGTYCSKSNEFPLNKAEKLPIYPHPGKMSPSNQEKHECKGKKKMYAASGQVPQIPTVLTHSSAIFLSINVS